MNADAQSGNSGPAADPVEAPPVERPWGWAQDTEGRPVLDLIPVAGDWHGATDWAVGRVMSAGERGQRLMLHVGDFGIWPGPSGKKYLLSLEKACARSGVTIAVTPGNHEDWPRLDARTPKDRGDGLGPVIELMPHIVVFPRGARFEVVSSDAIVRSVLSLGGAPSIDYEYRNKGYDWFPSEQITAEDVERVIASGYADVMIAHDSPGPPYCTQRVADILAGNPFGWSDKALAYAAVGRDRMTAAFEAVAPRLFFHGHYHCGGEARVDVLRTGRDGEREPGKALVVSLNQQRMATNMALFDVGSLGLG